MPLLFCTAKSELAQYVDGGVCQNDIRIGSRINEAEEILMNKANWPGKIQCVRMCGYNGCLTLPRDIRSVIRARIDGQYANVFDKWYEFLEGGPGMVEDSSGTYDLDLVDRGLVVTQYDPPVPMKIMVISDTAEAEGATLRIRGFDETRREIRQGDGTYGEEVPITSQEGYYTRNLFSQITSVEKPVTNGYVFLSAVSFTGTGPGITMEREHLVSYHPQETLPEYRRYAFKTTAYNCVADASYRINALVKLQHVWKVLGNDRMQVSNLPALKRMIQAVHFYDIQDKSKGEEYEAIAEKLLLEEKQDHDTSNAKIDVEVSGVGFGDIIQP